MSHVAIQDLTPSTRDPEHAIQDLTPSMQAE